MIIRMLGNTWRCLRGNARWIWLDVAVPLALTRLALLLIGWFSRSLPRNLDYPARASAEQGWAFTPHWWLDIWARWDSGWLISVAAEGYVLRGDPSSVQSNFVFFPLYPFLTRGIIELLPQSLQTMSMLILIGVILSNLFLFGALIALYRLVILIFSNDSLARRAVFYALIYPTSFIFSSFMTEGTFLFFITLAFLAAHRRIWWAAGICGCCAALTRHVGVVVFAPLALMYLESLAWRPARIRWNVLWLLLIPAGLLVYLLSIYPITDDLMAPFRAQSAWNRFFCMPWDTLLARSGDWYVPHVAPIEKALFVVFAVSAVASLFVLPSLGYGVLTLMLMLLPLFTGTILGFTRYTGVLFPIFIMLAWFGERCRWVDWAITIFFIVLQTLFMMLWCQFYLVV